MNNREGQETTLIIEDKEGIRVNLEQALRLRKFRTESASDITSARYLISKYLGNIDVCVLDMSLEDQHFPGVTGAHLGLEILKLSPPPVPEFIIYTAFSGDEYNKLAFKLGTASYLHKAKTDQYQIIRIIRSLKIRRMLKSDNPRVREKITGILKSAISELDIVHKIFNQILSPAFEELLGVKFLFLITHNGITSCLPANSNLPVGADLTYQTLQEHIYAETTMGTPLTINSDSLPKQHTSKESFIHNQLHLSAFIPFSVNNNIRLSIGLIDSNASQEELPGEAKAMADIIGEYFKSEFFHLLIGILKPWSERESERRTMLQAAGKFCYRIGQSQISLLDRITPGMPNDEIRKCLLSIKRFSDNLLHTGKILDSVSGKYLENELLSPVSISNFLITMNRGMNKGRSPDENRFIINGDCTVHATVDDLYIIVSRIERLFAKIANSSPVIKITCEETDSHSIIVFEDSSKRLTKHLRNKIFHPFAYPLDLEISETESQVTELNLLLYPAVMLVEEKYNGWIIDESDSMNPPPPIDNDDDADPVGHRLTLKFPKLS